MIIDIRNVPRLGRLKIVETYAYYDEPVLYCCQNTAGHLYLVVAAAENKQHEVWLYARVSDVRLKLVRCGAVDLHDAFADPEDGSLLQVIVPYDDNIPLQTESVDPKRISKDMLPIPGERLDLKSNTLPELSTLNLKLYSYVVARDFGFAPNPFYGFCTLGTCKPAIRRYAKIGDWIVGTGSKTRGREGCLVFVMQVTEVMPFNEYWSDPRFEQKKPDLRGSIKQAFGDNIYYRDPTTCGWHQEDSHHSYPHGRPNINNIKNDTQTDRVLISNDYIYWGGGGPKIPEKYRNFRAGRGYKCNFPDNMANEFVDWIQSLGSQGYCGTPLNW